MEWYSVYVQLTDDEFYDEVQACCLLCAGEIWNETPECVRVFVFEDYLYAHGTTKRRVLWTHYTPSFEWMRR